ncbi:hypothetical protein GCM10022380_62110 [Amycolatopsis tucumanensis]|uniref:Uncharacterized protein n=1 Tax=Amycolatopsis tucumanensis TaxID=401106 RepID=A0ABP7J6B1_9PSEU
MVATLSGAGEADGGAASGVVNTAVQLGLSAGPVTIGTAFFGRLGRTRVRFGDPDRTARRARSVRRRAVCGFAATGRRPRAPCGALIPQPNVIRNRCSRSEGVWRGQLTHLGAPPVR